MNKLWKIIARDGYKKKIDIKDENDYIEAIGQIISDQYTNTWDYIIRKKNDKIEVEALYTIMNNSKPHVKETTAIIPKSKITNEEFDNLRMKLKDLTDDEAKKDLIIDFIENNTNYEVNDFITDITDMKKSPIVILIIILMIFFVGFIIMSSLYGIEHQKLKELTNNY